MCFNDYASVQTNVRLVADASTLVGEAFRPRGVRLLNHPRLDLFLAEEMWGETDHELERRVANMVRGGYRLPVPAHDLLAGVLKLIQDRVTIIATHTYRNRRSEARWRIPRDPREVASVAPALKLECGIWTADRDFFGCGLPIWATDVLQRYLETFS